VRVSILDRFRLDGRVAVVTGAGRGIGAACALALAEAGADIVIAARTREQLDVTAVLIETVGRQAYSMVADLNDVEQVRGVADPRSPARPAACQDGRAFAQRRVGRCATTEPPPPSPPRPRRQVRVRSTRDAFPSIGLARSSQGVEDADRRDLAQCIGASAEMQSAAGRPNCFASEAISAPVMKPPPASTSANAVSHATSCAVMSPPRCDAVPRSS
jgi:hypothetical protein